MITTKKITIGGKTYNIGDIVDISPISEQELKMLEMNGTLTKAKKAKKGK